MVMPFASICATDEAYEPRPLLRTHRDLGRLDRRPDRFPDSHTESDSGIRGDVGRKWERVAELDTCRLTERFEPGDDSEPRVSWTAVRLFVVESDRGG